MNDLFSQLLGFSLFENQYTVMMKPCGGIFNGGMRLSGKPSGRMKQIQRKKAIEWLNKE